MERTLSTGEGSSWDYCRKCRSGDFISQRVLNLEKKFTGLPVLKELLERGEVSVNKLARVASIATPQNEMELAEQVRLLPNRAIETLVRDENALNKPLIEGKPVHVHSLKLNKEVLKKLSKLQEKAAIAENLPEKQSRHMPVRTQKVVAKEHGSKCAVPTCKRPSEQLHHTQTYALSGRHDPHYLAPLCKEHHIIAHSINVKVQEKRREVFM